MTKKSKKRTPKKRQPRTCIHAICRECYRTKPNVREPLKLQVPHCLADMCCYCGHGTKAGFYYRDAAKLPLAELRIYHCNCARSKRKHPRYPKNFKAAITNIYYTKGELKDRVVLLPDGHLTFRGGYLV